LFVCLWVCYHDIACIDLHQTGFVGISYLQLVGRTSWWPAKWGKFQQNSMHSFEIQIIKNWYQMKQALRETQTLHAGYCKAEPKICASLQTPFPGAQDGQNFISWRYLQTQFGEDQCRQYRGNRPTNTRTNQHKQTHRQDRLQYTMLLSLARSVKMQLYNVGKSDSQ